MARISADGRVAGCYLHGLFAADAFRHAFLAAIRDRHASGLAYDAEIDAVLDALAEHLEPASRSRRGSWRSPMRGELEDREDRHHGALQQAGAEIEREAAADVGSVASRRPPAFIQ